MMRWGDSSYHFDVRSLRRAHRAGGDVAVSTLGIEIGVRLARLAAEAPVGTRLRISTRAKDGALALRVHAECSAPVDELRSGFTDSDAVLRHLAVGRWVVGPGLCYGTGRGLPTRPERP